MSVDHEGFALSEQEVRNMSFFHRLTRRGIGVKVLFLYTLLTIIMPAIYIAPTAILLGYLCIVKPRNVQRFIEWGCGHWLHQMVVRHAGYVMCSVIYAISLSSLTLTLRGTHSFRLDSISIF